MKQTFTFRLALLASFLSSGFALHAQELLVNPSAEAGAPATNGWTSANSGTNCSGSSGWRIQGGQDGYPAAFNGNYFFFPGCGGSGTGATYELYQSVDVTGSSAAIDAGKYTVSFSGYMSSFNQSPPDQTQIVVEYRNAGNTVLSSYNTGNVANISGWTRYSDARVAPVGTRAIRVRLIATSRNGNAIDSYFDNFSLVGVSTLPLNFLSFLADRVNDKVALAWKTANEINCKEFVVERSTNNVQFEPVTTIAAKGAAVNEYRYEDVAPAGRSEKVTYRIKQVDNDNRFTYSRSIPVTLLRGNEISIVVPGPVKGNVSVLLKAGTAGKGILRLVDFSGRTVLTQHVAVNAGRNTVMLDQAGALPNGLYLLELQYQDKVYSQKFMIQQ